MRSPKARTWWALLTLGIATTCWASPAVATWPHDVYTNLSIYGSSNYRNSPRACPDGAGGAFVCWEDFQGAGSCHCGPSPDVVLRRVSRDGVPLGMGIVLSRYGYTEGHQIVSDGHLGALVAWGEDHGIYVQRIGESGSILWTDGGVRVTSDTARV